MNKLQIPKVVSVQSFRQGTGKSTLAANVATILAQRGYRVGIADTDFFSPSLYILFGLEEVIAHTFNDYLWGICEIGEAVYTPIAAPEGVRENLFVLPSSGRPPDIMRMLRDTYHINLLDSSLRTFFETFELDTLIVDVHAGLSDSALLFMAMAELVMVMLRPDNQHYGGTSTMIHLARQLEVPRMMLILNEVSATLDHQTIKSELKQAYHFRDSITLLPYSSRMAELGGERLISWHNPHAPLSMLYEHLAMTILKKPNAAV